MKCILAVNSGETIVIYHPDMQEIRVSEISLKPVTSGFAQPVSLHVGWYLLKNIEECAIVDRPPSAMQDIVYGEVEKFSLFEDEGKEQS